MPNGLRIIGAAFPRTGTMSVRCALETLGCGPCYHMHELWLNPRHVSVWEAAGKGQMPDWRRFLAGYVATLDVPACLYWKELARDFPTAKVLLLRRDPEAWYASMYATVYRMLMSPEGGEDSALQMARRILLDGFFAGRFHDKDFAIEAYLKYCESVIAEVPGDRLLIYEATQGWAPLCRVLDCAVPDRPFPLTNTRYQFRARNRLSHRESER